MPRIETITLAAIACALAGCASDPQLSDAVGEFRAIQTEVGIAPDAVRPDPTYEAFLGRLDKNCNQTPVGQFSIRYVLLQQAPFLDLTSRFFNGIISEQSYVDTLSGWYFTSSLARPRLFCTSASTRLQISTWKPANLPSPSV